MELKYNLIEGNDAASRAILIMKYDLTKTLTENLISEQPESIMDRRVNAILRGQGVRSQKDYEFMEKFLDDANMYKFSNQYHGHSIC
jgi:hypothetical protein